MEKGDDVTKRAKRTDLFGPGGADARQPILDGREDLDPLDRIDAQVGIQPHVQLEHLRGIAGLLGDRLEQYAGNFRRAPEIGSSCPEAPAAAAGSSFEARGALIASTIDRRLRSLPSTSGEIDGSDGTRSCKAERISTRLIESIPRSASSCMSSSSTSAWIAGLLGNNLDHDGSNRAIRKRNRRRSTRGG